MNSLSSLNKGCDLLRQSLYSDSLHSTFLIGWWDRQQNTHSKLNVSIEDAFIWTNNKNDTYTTKSGYRWLLSLRDPVITFNPSHSWSWIWFNFLVKFFFWLTCHNYVATFSLLNHCKKNHSVTFVRCCLQNEFFLQCIQDCEFSRSLWHHIGFNNLDFFSNTGVYEWLKLGAISSQALILSAVVWRS
jgi:hypothetical protein